VACCRCCRGCREAFEWCLSSFVRALYHVCHQRLSNSLGQIARSCFCGDSIVWGRIPEATNLQPAIGQVVQDSCRSFLNPFSPFRTYRKYGVGLSCGKHVVSKWCGSKNWPKTSSHGTIVVVWVKDSAHFQISLATSRIREG